MNIGQLDLDFIKNYLGVESGFNNDDNELRSYMTSTYEYIKKLCSMTDEQIQASSILVTPFLLLVSDMYHRKTATIGSNNKINMVLDRFILLEKPIL